MQKAEETRKTPTRSRASLNPSNKRTNQYTCTYLLRNSTFYHVALCMIPTLGRLVAWWFVAPLVSRASKAGKPKNQKKIALSRVSLIKTSTAPHTRKNCPKGENFEVKCTQKADFPHPLDMLRYVESSDLVLGSNFSTFPGFGLLSW